MNSTLSLLKELIQIPSYSGEEDQTADLICRWLDDHGVDIRRQFNNVYAFNKYFDPSKPSLLLCSHHDTVKPNKAYTRDPFNAEVIGDHLYGLGSNDAGGCLVALMTAFTHFYAQKNLAYNLVLAAVAEEENAGHRGLRGLLPLLPQLDVAIIGEPTLLNMAVAEKGLIVYDAWVRGTPSHAAHPNDDVALYKTIDVLNWFKDCQLPKVSERLGPVKVTVTQIKAGSQHNVIPAQVELVIDVRVNDCYTNSELDNWLQANAPCEIKARSLKLGSSSIPEDHPLILGGIRLGHTTYGSPTLSDQAALQCPSLKFGPGDSTRSHSADEYLKISELQAGISAYINLLTSFLNL